MSHRNIRRIGALALAGALSLSLAACSNANDGDTIKIGTTDGSKKAWEVFESKAKDEGINLEVVDFSDYTTPNKALSEGSIDVNLFQHLKFLAQYNVGENDTLVPVGSTEIVPLALFWKDHDSLDGIEGQSVVIPSDASNQGRAINVLVQAGLVTLKESGLVTPNPSDIDPAKSKVTVTPVDAAQTPVAARPSSTTPSSTARASTPSPPCSRMILLPKRPSPTSTPSSPAKRTRTTKTSPSWSKSGRAPRSPRLWLRTPAAPPSPSSVPRKT